MAIFIKFSLLALINWWSRFLIFQIAHVITAKIHIWSRHILWRLCCFSYILFEYKLFSMSALNVTIHPKLTRSPHWFQRERLHRIEYLYRQGLSILTSSSVSRTFFLRMKVYRLSSLKYALSYEVFIRQFWVHQ